MSTYSWKDRPVLWLYIRVVRASLLKKKEEGRGRSPGFYIRASKFEFTLRFRLVVPPLFSASIVFCYDCPLLLLYSLVTSAQFHLVPSKLLPALAFSCTNFMVEATNKRHIPFDSPFHKDCSCFGFALWDIANKSRIISPCVKLIHNVKCSAFPLRYPLSKLTQQIHPPWRIDDIRMLFEASTMTTADWTWRLERLSSKDCYPCEWQSFSQKAERASQQNCQ